MELSTVQQSVIIGSLLGDGCIQKAGRSGRRFRYYENHCREQAEYLFWKKCSLESLGAKMRPYRRFDERYATYRYGYAMWTPVMDIWEEYRRLVYSGEGHKRISMDLLDQANDISLVMWICDDGSWNKQGGQVYLNTHRYGLEGNLVAKKWFEERWGLSPHVLPHKRWHFLYFPVADTKRLIALIEPFIPVPSMLYKVGKPVSEDPLVYGPSTAT